MHASLIWVQRVTESLYLLDWSGFIHRLQYLDLYYSMSHICFLCGIWKGLFLKREGSRSLRLQHLTCQVSVSCQTSTSQCYLQPNSCCCFHDVLACLLFVWWSALIFLTMELSTIKDFQLLTDNLPLTAPSATVLKMIPVAPKLQQQHDFDKKIKATKCLLCRITFRFQVATS